MNKERRKALKYKLAPVLKPQMDQYMKTKKNIPVNEMINSSDITDTVTMDVPFLLRILEFAREGAGDDNTIHKVAERLIVGSKDFGILTMDDYEPIMNQFEAPEPIGRNRLMQETDKLDYKMGYEAFQDGMKRNIHQSDKWLDGWDAAQDEAEQSSYYKLGENSKEYGEKISSKVLSKLKGKQVTYLGQPYKVVDSDEFTIQLQDEDGTIRDVNLNMFNKSGFIAELRKKIKEQLKK